MPQLPHLEQHWPRKACTLFLVLVCTNSKCPGTSNAPPLGLPFFKALATITAGTCALSGRKWADCHNCHACPPCLEQHWSRKTCALFFSFGVLHQFQMPWHLKCLSGHGSLSSPLPPSQLALVP